MEIKKRYSDEDLAEFKELIVKKLAQAQESYDMYKGILNHSDGNDIFDTSPTFKVMEEGANVMSKEEAGQIAERQRKYIESLQNALVRIENKSYGICRETGELIQKERLKAVPHATLSIDAKNKQSKF